jgi:hypothetical protein
VKRNLEGTFVLCDDGRLLRTALTWEKGGTPLIEMTRDVVDFEVGQTDMCVLVASGQALCRGAHGDTGADEGHAGCPWHTKASWRGAAAGSWKELTRAATGLIGWSGTYCAIAPNNEVLCWGHYVERFAKVRCPAPPLKGLPYYNCEPCRLLGRDGQPIRARRLWGINGYCFQKLNGDVECLDPK